jgi:hypothetical protein
LLTCSYTQLWHFHQRWRWDQGIYLPFFDFWRRRLVHNAPLPSLFFSFTSSSFVTYIFLR